MDYTNEGKTTRFLAFRVADPNSVFYRIDAMHQRDRDAAEARCARPSDNHDPGDAEVG
jgi:hypothetical protein